MNKEEIMNKIQLYEFCENMEELYDDYYVPLQQENKQLKDNWDKLKEIFENEGIEVDTREYGSFEAISKDFIFDTILELEKSDSNE